jgi:hypothetical protein
MSVYHDYMRRGRRNQIRTVLRDRVSAVVKKRTNWDDTQIDRFSAFLDSVKAKLLPEDNALTVLPILPHGTLSSRTWGIEVEAPSIDGVLTPEFWELKGDGSLRSLSGAAMLSRSVDPTYSNPPKIPLASAHTLPGADYPEFTVPEPVPASGNVYGHTEGCSRNVYDHELDEYRPCDCGYREYAAEVRAHERLRREYNEGRNRAQSVPSSSTGEYNSPILRSFHSRGLKYLCSELEPRLVNNSAGIHIHVNSSDLTPEQAVRVGIVYTALEPLFEKEYARDPNVRTFCQPVEISELINRFNKMREAKEQGTTLANMRFTSRYWTVNLQSLARHGTIEFRAMGPMYNYEHLVRWAYLCRELINIAKANVPQSAWSKVRTMADLVTLFSRYGKETPTPEWAKHEEQDDSFNVIVQGLGTEKRRLPHPSTLVDGDILSPLVVNDDYNARRTYMTGQRPASTLMRQRVAAGRIDGGDADYENYDDDEDDDY